MLEADKFVEIKNCRLCNSRNLDSFVDFGLIPLGNNLLEIVKILLEPMRIH